MSFENPTPSQEKQPIALTQEQFSEVANYFGEWDEEIIAKLRGLGIQLDNGIIDVVIEGKPEKMQTSREDFGTLLDHTI